MNADEAELSSGPRRVTVHACLGICTYVAGVTAVLGVHVCDVAVRPWVLSLCPSAHTVSSSPLYPSPPLPCTPPLPSPLPFPSPQTSTVGQPSSDTSSLATSSSVRRRQQVRIEYEEGSSVPKDTGPLSKKKSPKQSGSKKRMKAEQ